MSFNAGKDTGSLAAVVMLGSVWGVALLRFPLHMLYAILTGKVAGMCLFSGVPAMDEMHRFEKVVSENHPCTILCTQTAALRLRHLRGVNGGSSLPGLERGFW